MKSTTPQDTQDRSTHLNIVAQAHTGAEWTESHTTAGDLYKVGVSTIICTSIVIVRSSTNFIKSSPCATLADDTVYLSTKHRYFAHYGPEFHTRGRKQWQCSVWMGCEVATEMKPFKS